MFSYSYKLTTDIDTEQVTDPMNVFLSFALKFVQL